MRFNTLLTVASLVCATTAAPKNADNAEHKAVIKSRSAAYENEGRDPEASNEHNAVINSRFGAYENEKRGEAPKDAVLNSRFGAYENEKRDDEAAEHTAVINSRFGA